MLLRTEKLISSLLFKKILLRNNFCYSKPNIPMLELQKQKADLSFEIYQLILKKPKSLDLEKKTLNDLIMEKIYQKSQSQGQNISHQKNDLSTKNSDEETFKYHAETRKPFIDLFEKGYLVDSKIFPPKYKQEKIESNQEQQKFIFHPTYLITHQVFKQLHTLSNKIRIMAGSYGISKTVSVCLFWHLAKFIDEYRFQEGVSVSEDMMRVPKLIYWPISTETSFSQNDVKKIILDQCPEILRKLNLTDETQYNWRPSIKKFYSKNFPETISNLVIDQFHYVAQLGRTHEKEIKNVFKQRRYNELQKIQDQNVRLFYKLKEKILFFVHQFHGVLGLSPTYLENKFFKEQIVYATSTNSLIPLTYWVQYSSRFYQCQSLAQIVDYFMFEMNQKIFKNLKNTKVSQETQKEIKKQCFDELIERFNEKQYFFFTPLDIAQKINGITNIQSFDKPIQQLKNEVKKIFQNIVNKSTQQQKQLIIKHFQKQSLQRGDKEKRIRLMFSIYNYLIKHIGNKAQIKDIEFSTISFIYTLRYEYKEINRLFDERLIQYDQYFNQFELMLPPKFLVKMIQPFVDKYFKTYIQVILQSIKNNQYYRLADSYIDYAFIQVLKKGNFKFSFDLNNMERKRGVNTYEFDISNEIYTFQQLQKTSPGSDPISVSILDRFYQTIKQMRQKSQKYSIVFPVTKKIKNLDGKINNFALISNDLANNLISIWLIDFTSSKHKIQPKIQDFISQFLEFKDRRVTELPHVKNNPNVEINYVVLGPKNDQINIYHNDFTNALKEKFDQQITFKTLYGSNVFTVEKLKKSKSCLLKRIAYIDLDRQFKFDIKSQKNNKYLPLD